jgi:hypothetical protein
MTTQERLDVIESKLRDLVEDIAALRKALITREETKR